ncbi:endonuclease domain-containing protein [Microbacterium sp. 22242]|uniref:endonuclease domain-containing protein n=1 Tax=Microbacterium sp. 22242 TaxID=3453896 RepID=UPI003F856187
MHHRIPLPPSLGTAFTLREAAAAGIGRARSDARDLHRPFCGVRASSSPESFADLVACGARRLKPRQRFVGVTAARLWGLPHPRRWDPTEPLEIVVPPDATPPKSRGIRGRRLIEDRARTWRIGSLPVVDPVAAVLSCAEDLDLMQAVVLLDALLTRADDYPGLLTGRPVISCDEIDDRVRRWARFPGRSTMLSALPLARVGVESPKETESRLLLVGAGLPEPVVQHEVRDGRRLVARVDLAYPQWKIAIEYEGDGHRTDVMQWRRDIRRQRDLEDRGWLVIRITQLDLTEGLGALVARIRRAIALRQA